MSEQQARLTQTKEDLVKARKRFDAAAGARDSLIEYMRLTMPDPEDPDDIMLSKYQITPQARLLCQIMEKVERRELQRVGISIGPQMGKSAILSRGAPAWMTGRNPALNMILGSYNQDFANEFGDDVRAIVNSAAHKQVFPEHELRIGGAAKSLLITSKNGKSAFVGVGGSGTGKPADVFVVDDPIRNDDDAQSEVHRQRVWNWFTKVANTRIHNDSAIVVVHCLTGDTMVTMADVTQKALRDVRPGDQVATYEAGEVSAAAVLNWINHGPDRVFEIRMKSGGVVKANARHPFLVVGEQGEETWQRTDSLKKGNRIRRVTAASGKALSATPRAAISRRSAMPCANPTTASLNGRSKIFLPRTTILPECVERIFGRVTGLRSKNTIGFFNNRVGCAPFANVRLLKSIYRFLGKGSRKNICASTIATTPRSFADSSATTATSPSDVSEVRSNYESPLTTLKITEDEILGIFEAGVEDVFDIQVDRTESFIANGLAAHNTRWHEDDLLGRLCDPDHPMRNKDYAGIADDWTYINLPAVIDDPTLAKALGLTLEPQEDALVKSQFGTKPIAALWPERFSLSFLAKQKRMDKRGFMSLRMGKPAPEDGDYFKDSDLVLYHSPGELPVNLRKYGASDHAVTEKQKNDASVMGVVGIDDQEDIWILPDLIWDRMETDGIVESLLTLFKAHTPQLWWMESELISKSFGPFLRKRMHEESIYTTIDPVTVGKDKKSRARSIQGRMRMHKVHFPAFAPWWSDAHNELMKFPYGTHDDFVDWLAHIGQGLTKEVGMPKPKESENVIRVGSLKWMLQQTKMRERREKQQKATAAW